MAPRKGSKAAATLNKPSPRTSKTSPRPAAEAAVAPCVASFEDGSKVVSYNGKELTFQVGLHYAGKPLFQLSRVCLEHGYCYAVVAPNGSGKTSLLNALRHLPGFPEESLGASIAHVRSDWTELDLGMREDDPDAESGPGVKSCERMKPLEYLLRVLRKRQHEVQRHITALEKKLEDTDVDPDEATAASERLGFLYETMDTALDEDEFARAATEALTKLGFENFSGTGGLRHIDKPAAELSGGWRYKLKLAEVLLSQPELLLIDEPSYLDQDGTDWLVGYIRQECLKQHRAIVVVISHKVQVLDELADRILYITPDSEDKDSEILQFNGNYAAFLQAQVQQEASSGAKEKNFAGQAARAQNALKNLQREQQKSAQSTSAKISQNSKEKRATNDAAGRGESKGGSLTAKKKMLEKQKEELKEQLREAQSMSKHQFNSPLEIKGEASAEEDVAICTLQDVSFAYGMDSTPKAGDPPRNFLLEKLNLAIYPKDRIALVGRNGAGKSTLIQLIMGTVAPVEGSVHFPHALRVAYFPQNAAMSFLLAEHADKYGRGRTCTQVLIEEWQRKQGDEALEMSVLQARTHLGHFGLKDAVAASRPVTSLSTGQRTRLYFAMLLLPQHLGDSHGQLKPNLLILDEVSDNLDRDTVDSLVDCFGGFEGAVLAASHERAAFLDQFCDTEWLVEAGKVRVRKLEND